jgi:hypothetical protein
VRNAHFRLNAAGKLAQCETYSLAQKSPAPTGGQSAGLGRVAEKARNVPGLEVGVGMLKPLRYILRPNQFSLDYIGVIVSLNL